MNKLVVKPHRPWRARLIVALALLLAAAAGWGSFELGRHRAGFDLLGVREQESLMIGQIAELEQLNRDLREQKAVLERSRQIEGQAYKELEATVAVLQDEILELKGELAFYRGIVAPRETAQGLRLQSFEVSPSGPPRSYRYKLVLTQVLKNDTVTRGSVTLDFEGSLNGELTMLGLERLSVDAVKELQYKFKYFQNLDGAIVLPEGFVPSRVIVRVDPRGKGHAEIEKVFDWPAEET